ncbi:MAG: tetratricopeptide repeat protein [Terracidiphilus sp.]|jgi:tetratricopeptide (TPR) repeat protein
MRSGNTATIAPSPGTRRRRLGLALLIAACLFVPRLAIGQAGDYTRAEAMVRAHRWDDGLALLAPLLKSEPRNAKALNLAGLALTGKGDIQQANLYFSKCLQVNPGFVPALKNLAINEFNEKQYAAAEKHLLAAAMATPDDPVVNLYLGEIEFRQQKYQNAADRFSLARDLALRSPNAAAHLALSDLKTGQQDKALEILDRIPPEQIEPPSQFALGLELEQLSLPQRSIAYLEAVRQRFPESYDIGFDLMLDDIAAKQYAQAIQVAEDLIARGRETSELNNVLAEAYAGSNQIQHAVDALRRAIALDPADEENYLDFASLCMDQRSLQAGMSVIQVALQSHPHSDRLIFMRGVLHAMQDEFELAEKDFKLAADLAPQTNFGYIGLGVAYLETGHDAQAIQVLRQRLREKPNDASLLYLLGEGLIRTGAAPGAPAYAEAQAILEKSVLLNPNLCLPHISLGTIYLDEDRAKDAVTQFEQARAIDPKERSAYSHLAVAYRRLGQVDKAKETLNSLKDVIEQERRSTREKMKTAAGETAGDGPAEKNH